MRSLALAALGIIGMVMALTMIDEDCSSQGAGTRPGFNMKYQQTGPGEFRDVSTGRPAYNEEGRFLR